MLVVKMQMIYDSVFNVLQHVLQIVSRSYMLIFARHACITRGNSSNGNIAYFEND